MQVILTQETGNMCMNLNIQCSLLWSIIHCKCF